MTVSINISAYVLRVHIGPTSELVFCNNRLLALRGFEMRANGVDVVETIYKPTSVDPTVDMEAPDDAASYETYPLRFYIERDQQAIVNVSFKGRPVSLFHKVELILEAKKKAQIRLYHRKPLPDELRESLLDVKAELHEEPEDASL
jgi:hypothetical protein